MDIPALARRAFYLSVAATAVFSLLIFLPARTIFYWHAWVYLAILLGSSLVLARIFLRRDPALLESRLIGGAWAEPSRRQKLIQAVNSLLIFGLFVACGADYGLNGARVPAGVSLAAAVLLVAAFGFFGRVLLENRHAAATVQVTKDQRVIDTGPYAVVRHPLYAAAALYFLASPLALGSWWGYAFALLACGGIVIRLLDEERVLRAELPGYAAYCRKVRWRLVPFVW